MGALDDWQLHYEELNQPKKAYPAIDVGLRRLRYCYNFVHSATSFVIRKIYLVLGNRRIR